MRHPTWQYLIDWTSTMTARHGGTVYEKDGSANWDWGQALSRDVYGRDWQASPEFDACNDIDPQDPAPTEMVDAARRWASGDWPGWASEPLSDFAAWLELDHGTGAKSKVN